MMRPESDSMNVQLVSCGYKSVYSLSSTSVPSHVSGAEEGAFVGGLEGSSSSRQLTLMVSLYVKLLPNPTSVPFTASE